MLKKNYRRIHGAARRSTLLAYQRVFKHRQIVKFLIAGSVATFADLSIYYVLTYLVGLWYIMSSMLSFIFAFCISFGLQKFWTFRDKNIEKAVRQTALYFVVAITNLGISTFLIYFFVDYLNFHKFLSKIFASGMIAIESFFVYRYVIFAKGTSVN